ncbi:hypothetical protein J3458_001388 [Metarhizium acridum]|uniref:Endonuclease/exonuclease/phosphatase domain-containing protein n=1 Tax=Metarhizium acridum (strain CQMa 102) TaxID=655827 RepID=E9DWV9_METAQ|nr:uncharacterized protein MAC_02107 [Metarhizium acridum CQMa 102]EFY91822.1 hypothetical protein MAC_02107 [Metarhizium acridum CQMa 102]KAG8424615.1 hypothetical protein J3458_001388 [Metarhizium acridum]
MFPSSYYTWDSDSEVWQPMIKSTTSPANHQAQFSAVTTLALYSWNIGFMLPFAEARMSASLAHLEEVTKQLASTTAVATNLQECHPSDLVNISQKQWAQERFHMAATYPHLDEELAGAIIAGDFNAIQPFDATLHSNNDLKDA